MPGSFQRKTEGYGGRRRLRQLSDSEVWSQPYGIHDPNSPVYQVPWLSAHHGGSALRKASGNP